LNVKIYSQVLTLIYVFGRPSITGRCALFETDDDNGW